jgi:hypothetical protein
MNPAALTRALDHARRSLAAAHERLYREHMLERPLPPSLEGAEARVSAAMARLRSELPDSEERRGGLPDTAAIEAAADALDGEIAALDDLLEAEDQDPA